MGRPCRGQGVAFGFRRESGQPADRHRRGLPAARQVADADAAHARRVEDRLRDRLRRRRWHRLRRQARRDRRQQAPPRPSRDRRQGRDRRRRGLAHLAGRRGSGRLVLRPDAARQRGARPLARQVERDVRGMGREEAARAFRRGRAWRPDGRRRPRRDPEDPRRRLARRVAGRAGGRTGGRRQPRVSGLRRQVQAKEDDRRLLHAGNGLQRRRRLGRPEVQPRPREVRPPVLARRRLQDVRVPARVRRRRQSTVLDPGRDRPLLSRRRPPLLPFRAGAHAFRGWRVKTLPLRRDDRDAHVRERREGRDVFRHLAGRQTHRGRAGSPRHNQGRGRGEQPRPGIAEAGISERADHVRAPGVFRQSPYSAFGRSGRRPLRPQA